MSPCSVKLTSDLRPQKWKEEIGPALLFQNKMSVFYLIFSCPCCRPTKLKKSMCMRSMSIYIQLRIFFLF